MQKINGIKYSVFGLVDEETKVSLFKTHKVFVLPAFTAGFGIAAVEAAEMGLIVGTQNTVVPENILIQMAMSLIQGRIMKW